MSKEFFKYEYYHEVMNDNGTVNKVHFFTCEPGNNFEKITLNKLNDVITEHAKDTYSEHYTLLMKNNISKMNEFDFIPSILEISVPLDNQGYTFAIVLTLFTVVFNFVQP